MYHVGSMYKIRYRHRIFRLKPTGEEIIWQIQFNSIQFNGFLPQLSVRFVSLFISKLFAP
jgi:hypothetical protein